MRTPPEALKAFCNRIASAAMSSGGAQLARQLRVAGMLGEPFQPAGAAPFAPPAREEEAPPAGVDRVGIWERKRGETHFVRRMDTAPEWSLWANLGRIEPKGGRRRVVLIGESVARGYLYDPRFTPAMVLRAILERRMNEAVDVVDLARTDLRMEVGELARSALLLEPDAVVLFAGNNWNVSFKPPLSEIALIDSRLREEGIPGLKRFAEEKAAARVRGMVGEVSSFYRARGIPVVWLVPEFNLGSWRDPVTNAPHLPGTGNCDWLEHWQAARRAFDAGDLQKAAELARRMVEIDQGVAAAGLYLAAECSLRSGDLGDLKAARRHLELARDAVIWDTSRHVTPRAYGVVQEALRNTAAEHDGIVVDLPRVFREHLGEAIPDRRLFLDYCHLTAAGIRVAMAAAASPVLRALKRVEVPWRELVDEQIAPSREVEAEAAFLAAIHNAHWGQGRDAVSHYCSLAARTSPAIAEVMTRFIEIQTRRAPMLMCRAAEEIASLASQQLQQYLLRSNDQRLDRLLIDAIIDSLAEIGVDARGGLERLRREEHSLTRDTANLLDFYYCSGSGQPQEAMWAMPQQEAGNRFKESDFYRAYGIDSRFVFVGEAGRPVRLRLTGRLPGSTSSPGNLLLSLNDRPQAKLEIGGVWETWDLAIPGDAVREGVNEVSIRWPLPEFPGQEALASAFADPDAAALEFFPCFGEIHTLTAADSRPAFAKGD
jgi:hypothetical protein